MRASYLPDRSPIARRVSNSNLERIGSAGGGPSRARSAAE